MKWLIKYTLPGIILLLGSSLVMAQDLDSLRTELENLKAQMGRIEQLEKALAQMANDSSDLIADPDKNFVMIMKDGKIYKNTIN